MHFLFISNLHPKYSDLTYSNNEQSKKITLDCKLKLKFFKKWDITYREWRNKPTENMVWNNTFKPYI